MSNHSSVLLSVPLRRTPVCGVAIGSLVSWASCKKTKLEDSRDFAVRDKLSLWQAARDVVAVSRCAAAGGILQEIVFSRRLDGMVC